MNKKLIAAAVSAAVVAPVASHADAVLYGRINNAIDINDLDGSDDADSTTDITNVVSRIGVRANTELNNGLGVHGHYEFLTVSDREEDDDGSGIDDTRIATVGVSGDFGRFDVGQQWSAYFNTFGTMISPTYSLGYYLYSSVGGGVFRASNTIKYSNNFGAVTAQLDVRLNEQSSEDGAQAEKINGDGIGLGLSFAVSDNITIAAAFDSEDGDDDAELVTRAAATSISGGADGVTATPVLEYSADDGRSADADRIGIAVKANFGGYWASLGWQNYETSDLDQVVVAAVDETDDEDDRPVVGVREVEGADIDTVFLYVGGNFSEQTNWLVGYSESDNGADAVTAVAADATNGLPAVTAARETDDATQLTWGVYHNVGGGLRLYYEATSVEIDNVKDDDIVDGARHFLGMRIDF